MFGMILHKGFKRTGGKDKNKQFLVVNLLSKDEHKKYLKYLQGNIIISHCKGHDCIILLFDFEHFEDNHLRLLSSIFFIDKYC